METPTVVTLVAQLARLQLEDTEELDSFFIRGQELLTRQQEAGKAVSGTIFNALFLNGLPMSYEIFVIQESFNPATNFTELRKMLQNFHESTAQRHKGQSGLVTLAVKRDFKKGHRKGNCFVQGRSYPVEDSRHARGEWLYRPHSDEHRRVPGLCAHGISVQKSQQRGFQSDWQRLCEDQHTSNERRIPMQTQNYFVCAWLFFKPLISLKKHRVGT